MLFNSFRFLVFFPAAVFIYFLIPKRLRYIWLLAASYFFYMNWNAKYALLLAGSTLVTWFGGLLLGLCQEKNAGSFWKKWIVALSFACNLGILGFFKYFDFALVNVNALLERLGMQVLERPFDIVLPVGISFYTFQALGYTVDVYRQDIRPQKNLFKYALFVSFFPQLVAGPIERSKNLLKQLSEPRKFDYPSVRAGLLLMLWGFFVKLVIADRAAVLVNTVYSQYLNYSGFQLITANILFAVQIYCDFMGYSTIARGAAKVMGYDLMSNFERPYFSQSIKEFWRRWHISLSTWLRDYLYIPLGGSRCARIRKYFNILVTFAISGLWHGSKGTFVLWGGGTMEHAKL